VLLDLHIPVLVYTYVGMNLSQLRSLLGQHPDSLPRFVLPGGESIPAHVHITEVGHVAKRFVDCGGVLRESETCVLQAWESDHDTAHRLSAGKLASILALAARVLPAADLEVEVEYQGCSVSQFPLVSGAVRGSELVLNLATKHTGCLAQEACGTECCPGERTDGACC
jgi:hypothetical protein